MASGYIEGVDREQQVIFPEVLDEYVTAENPVRFIDAFVASLDLAALGFQRTTAAATGRPAYTCASAAAPSDRAGAVGCSGVMLIQRSPCDPVRPFPSARPRASDVVVSRTGWSPLRRST